ncbi:hypothetical protein [Streptomyces sp. NBRC 109706]|uniref:hypothetical protein n=1 Tax=Streptomyces sp. NBRC 109706 TaxID=1550035 RepID=UPI00078264D0|nr:hypothetical protein [Streptomyces sp. NBRC 109706]
MTRRNRIAYAAALAAGALLLTSCGGGGDDTVDDEIAGAQTTAEDTPEPEPSEDPAPTEPADDDRPEIDLGPDLENVYESEVSGGPEVDAIVESLQGFNDAVDEAIVSRENDRPALRYYIAGEALDRTVRILDSMYEDGHTSAGKAHYVIREVNLVDETSATFSYCRDYSETVTLDVNTGEIVEPAEPGAVPDLFFGRVKLNTDGVWQAVDYDLEPNAAECA